MTENAEGSQVSWFDITVAGRQFNIASRRGEAHIREVETLIGQTLGEIQDRLGGQPTANKTLLLALNLADQVLSQRAEHEAGNGNWGGQLAGMVDRLNRVLPHEHSAALAVETEKKDTTAVLEKPDFF